MDNNGQQWTPIVPRKPEIWNVRPDFFLQKKKKFFFGEKKFFFGERKKKFGETAGGFIFFKCLIYLDPRTREKYK